MIQPEQESMSEISNMETSTISGYRESFGGFDMSLQELERLEMQASLVKCVAKEGEKACCGLVCLSILDNHK